MADCAVLGGTALTESPLGAFAAAFERMVRDGAGNALGCRAYEANEVTLMAYEGSDAGISPHLDRSRYRLLVAVFSLSGEADLDLVHDREGRRRRAGWRCRAGDLVLLRAPGLGGLADGRPLHQLRPAEDGARLSLSLRMDTAGSPTTPGTVARANGEGSLSGWWSR